MIRGRWMWPAKQAVRRKGKRQDGTGVHAELRACVRGVLVRRGGTGVRGAVAAVIGWVRPTLS
jgi:hypothetical protein